MHRFLLSCLLFLAVACSARAALVGPYPLHFYFSEADTIYDARVVSSEKEKTTFSVLEVLRGNKVETLTLTLRPGAGSYFGPFEKGSEWILLSSERWRQGPGGDAIGDDYKILGWLCAPVIREEGKAYVWDSLLDPEKKTPVSDKKVKELNYITLQHFKQMMEGKSFVSWPVGAGIKIKDAADSASDVVIATFAPEETWKPAEQEIHNRIIDMQVMDSLRGTLSGKVSANCPMDIEDAKPEPGTQYIAFLTGSRIYKMLPATKENIDAVKAAMASPPEK